MFRLYKYELKKLFSQKAFICSFLLLFLVLNAISLTPIVTGSINDVKAKDELSSRLIDDSLINEFNNDSENIKYLDIKEFIKYCTNSNEYKGLSSSDIYSKRLETTEKFIEEDYLTIQENNYWDRKSSGIEVPFIYKRADAYTEVYNSVYVMNFIDLILVAIAITGIFADESSSGADQIIFSSKYGKNKLFFAKIFAALTIGIIIPSIMFGFILLTNIFVYGNVGFNTPIQVFLPTVLYPISIGESVITMYFLLLTASIVYVCFASFLSVLTKNRSVSTAALVVLMFLSMFNIPNKYRFFSQIWNIIPSGHIGTWTYIDYRLINIFGHYFNTIEYSSVIWICVSILFIIISKSIYKKYEVEGK